MRRTFLAVGLAVLVSLLRVPYGGMHRGVIFNGGYRPFWDVPGDLINVIPLILQTVFLAVLAAVLVNLRRKKGK